LQQFSREISQGKWETRGIPSLINSEIHLNSIYSILKDEIIPKLKLEEFYQIDREEVLKCFENKIGGFLKFFSDKYYLRDGKSFAQQTRRTSGKNTNF